MCSQRPPHFGQVLTALITPPAKACPKNGQRGEWASGSLYRRFFVLAGYWVVFYCRFNGERPASGTATQTFRAQVYSSCNSIVLTSPHEAQRKDCNSGSASLLGEVFMSIISLPQRKHGGSLFSMVDNRVERKRTFPQRSHF